VTRPKKFRVLAPSQGGPHRRPDFPGGILSAEIATVAKFVKNTTHETPLDAGSPFCCTETVGQPAAELADVFFCEPCPGGFEPLFCQIDKAAEHVFGFDKPNKLKFDVLDFGHLS